MRLLLALCLMLLAPATAIAREPVISYVDENGVFRLYDAELDAEVEPPPPVPANFLGFRHGMSLDGRYIVFNDDPAPRKLHLLDRATNTEVPLPGIDVYANPGGLTVSNTGLIAFDDNGNGPAVVYDSATGSFVDTGLAADNGHRQTRLSGDGRFLATTCNDSNCVDDLDTGADPYVQDLAAKTDTGFPHDPNSDEEHPCLDADGSVLGFDKDPPGDMEPDIFLFDRTVPPPQPIGISGVNTADEPDAFCVLDGPAEYLGYFDNNTEFRVLHIASDTFVTLPPDKEFGTTSLFSAPYTPPGPGGGGGGGPTTGPPAADTTRPVARRFGMTKRRFRPGRRATAFRFVLSEPGVARIAIRRGGRRAGTLTRRGRPAGPNRISFSGRVRGRALRPGRYIATLRVTDAAGNVSAPRVVRFRVLPRRVAG